MTKDEKACRSATKEYSDAIDKYRLDSIEDSWRQKTKRYMSDAFVSGFYRGRDYERGKEKE